MSHETRSIFNTAREAEAVAKARKAAAEAEIAEQEALNKRQSASEQSSDAGSPIACATFGAFLALISIPVFYAAATSVAPAALIGIAFLAVGVSFLERAFRLSGGIFQGQAAPRQQEEAVVEEKESDIYARYAGRTGSDVIHAGRSYRDEEIFDLHRRIDQELETLQRELPKR